MSSPQSISPEQVQDVLQKLVTYLLTKKPDDPVSQLVLIGIRCPT